MWMRGLLGIHVPNFEKVATHLIWCASSGAIRGCTDHATLSASATRVVNLNFGSTLVWRLNAGERNKLSLVQRDRDRWVPWQAWRAWQSRTRKFQKRIERPELLCMAKICQARASVYKNTALDTHTAFCCRNSTTKAVRRLVKPLIPDEKM
jgi:hypothetical protein